MELFGDLYKKSYASVAEYQEFLRIEFGLFIEGHTNAISSVAISRDNAYIVSCSCDLTIRIWNPSNSLQVATLHGHESYIQTLAITNDTKSIVSGSSDKTIRVWSIHEKSQKAILLGHTDCVWVVAITRDDKQIISGSQDSTIRIWSCRFIPIG